MVKKEDTQFGGVRIEIKQRTFYETFKKQVFNEGCSFKKRIADFFQIGACRAYFENVRPKKLTTDNKQKPRVFNISPVDSGKKTTTLQDKEDFWNIFRIIAFATKIKEAKSNKESEEWKKSHEVVIKGTECTRIVEELFKGGWTSPMDNSFKNLAENQSPDDILCSELGFMEQNVLLMGGDEELSE